MAQQLIDYETNETVAGFAVPGGISDALAAGISRYRAAIDAVGGYGVRVRATMPDGVVREGRLVECGWGGCQPGLVQDDGRRFRIVDLAGVEVAS